MFIIKELRPLLFRLLDFQLGTQPNSLKQKENFSLIFSAVKFNMFDLQHNECDYSETCLHKGFSQHIPAHVSKESYYWMMNHFKAYFGDILFCWRVALVQDDGTVRGRGGINFSSRFPYALVFLGTNFSLKRTRGIVLELIFIFYERESVSKLFFYSHRYQANQGWFSLFTDAGIIVFKSIYSNSAKLWPKSLNARRKLQLHLIKSADWV